MESTFCGAAMCDEGTTFVDGQCVAQPPARCGRAACGKGTYLAENGLCKVLPPEGTPLRLLIDAVQGEDPDPRLKKTFDSIKNP